MTDTTPEDIARRLGVTGLRVRGVLRQLYPRQAPGKGGRWDLSREQVEDVLSYFRRTRQSGPRMPSERPTQTPGDVPRDWFWEGHVQDAMARHLRSSGWTITALSDTAARATGPDIEATSAGRHLMVEVKGYPSIGYRDPRRAHEIKRTNPTLQAKHWYADALLKVVRHRGMHPHVAVAIAVPDFPRYRSLLGETRGSLQRLGVGFYVVSEEGSVTEVLTPEA